MLTSTLDLKAALRRDPAALMQRALRRGMAQGRWARLTGASRRLQNLPLAGRLLGANRRHAGLQCVPLSQISGTESHGVEFDRDFNPLSERTADRWLSICRAVEQGRALPPVDLLKVGGVYFVRDGHHRISVARALGQVEIEAHVTVWN